MNTTPVSRENLPEGLERLLTIEEIQRLKARYCRYIDTKQWDKLNALFVPHARFDGLGSVPPGADVTAFVNGVSTRLQEAVSIHHCHMPDIVLTGPESARGVWAMMDYLQWPSGFSPKEAPGQSGFVGYGHYEEEYTKVEGRWLISFLRLTRLRIDALPLDHPTPRKGQLTASHDWTGVME
ncbi:SnoaL-like domain-containing protein [Bradyrhizobium erythrophlei]|nr:SnoaL-like domain-containing protein [Bradyrhizobium erythrophlei]